MKILLKDSNEEIESEIIFDKEIDLLIKTDYIFNDKIDNNSFLKFMDFLLEEIDINKANEVYYFGENNRIWSYIVIFAYIDEKIRLYYKTEEIKESSILRLNMTNNGFTSKDVKKIIELEEYEKMPKYLKNLYYKTENKIYLSKIGEVYVKNIEN